MKRTAIWLILALSTTGSIQAETIFIDDNLRVGVRPLPDSSLRPVAVVKTGMQLELLEKRGSYLHIRTPDGLSGWIKDIYTSEIPPAMLRLKALRQQQAAVARQLKELERDKQLLAAANRSLEDKVGELSAIRKQLQQEAARRQARQDEQAVAGYGWGLLILLVAGAGFSGGLSWHRQMVMRRLGGLRL
jgi:DNA-binding transcriptional MerR regulator